MLLAHFMSLSSSLFSLSFSDSWSESSDDSTKQGESTCDACCFGFGGVSLESCMGNTLVSPHCFESNPHYQERQFPIVMSSMFICQSSLCLIQRVAACRSVSHRVALCRSMLHCSGHSYVGSSWI
jgi:hypothetical protein